MHETWTLVGTLRRGLMPAALLGIFVLGCAATGDSSFGAGPDPDPNRQPGPTEPAPTGQRWEAVEDDKGCGRSGIEYVLVDELCGGDGLGYAAPSLQAPMFRDGARFGQTVLAVDGTHLWALDAHDPAAVTRTELLAGLGQPVSATAHGTELLLAGGTAGLVRLDATDPMHPTRTTAIPLEGFALDVEATGPVAHLALGRGGLGRVDLAAGQALPSIPVAGYATGVTTRDTHAFVAACGSLAVVDLEQNQVIGRADTPGGALAAPAKDVALVGDVAFVASGRAGAVAYDISDPTNPQVLGNCTLPDPSFYASGVRVAGHTLYVAGGEYGILPLDVSAPRATCPSLVATPPPPPPAEPSDAGACTALPPWTVLPWETLWAPPPPAKDPIQTLPTEDVVYAFGDARRIGTRAVDVRQGDLSLLGRYDEPRRALGIAAAGARVLVVGARGGLFSYTAETGLVRTASDSQAAFHDGTAAVFTGGGRWVVLAGDHLVVEGSLAPVALAGPADAIAAVGENGIAVASKTGIDVLDLAANNRAHYTLPQTSELPLTLAANATNVFAAAPEWPHTDAVRLGTGAATVLTAHGVFDADEALDTTLWRTRLPRRQLLSTARGLIEVAVLGNQAGLVLHGASGGEQRIDLPPATYSAAAATEDVVYLTSIDRAFYRSTLYAISFATGVPKLTSTEVFTGAAAGVASANGHTFVADADGVVRVYDVGATAPSAVVSLEVTP